MAAGDDEAEKPSDKDTAEGGTAEGQTARLGSGNDDSEKKVQILSAPVQQPTMLKGEEASQQEKNARLADVGSAGDGQLGEPSRVPTPHPRGLRNMVQQEANMTGFSGYCATVAGHAIARRPLGMMCGCCGIMLLIVIVLGVTGGAGLSEDGPKDWDILGAEAVEEQDAIAVAENQVDCLPLPNGKCPTTSERDKADAGIIGIFLMYEGPKHDEGVFTAENLQHMCRVERVFLNQTGYPEVCHLTSGAADRVHNTSGASFTEADCQAQSSSIVERFYKDAGKSFAQCELLPAANVVATSKSLHDGLKNEATFAASGFYIGNDVVSGTTYTGGRTQLTRSALSLGYPLHGRSDIASDLAAPEPMAAYKDKFFEKFEEDFYKYFGYEVKGAMAKTFKVGTVEVYFSGFALMLGEMERIVNADIAFALFSIIFTGCYLAFHTRSFFVAVCSIFQIVLSLYLALFFYRCVFQVTYFRQLHMLLIFVILGIGADDVFVFSDAWYQFESSPSLRAMKSSGKRAANDELMLPERIAYAYRHAMCAVLNTSITTSFAFIATSVSPIMPIQTMGYYGALLVIVNYVLVITFTPCVFATMHCYQLVCPCWRFFKRNEKEATDVESGASPQEQDEGTPWVLQKILPVLKRRPVAIVLVVVLLVWGIANMAFAFQLAPPKEPLKWFPDDHMIERAKKKTESGFAASGADDYNVLTVAFGIEGVDRDADPGLDRWHPHEWFGIPVYDSTFNLARAQSQEYLRGFCERLRTAKCAEEGCKPFGTLVQPSDGAVSCFMEEFHVAQGNTTYEGEAFLEKLKTFRSDKSPQAVVGGASTWEKSIGFADGKLRYVQIKALMTLKRQQIDAVREPVYEALKDFLEEEKGRAPEGMRSILQTVPPEWAQLETSKAIVAGMWVGFAVCFPVAFLVLVCATFNVIVSLLAVITIMMVVGNVMGYCWLAGWSLGIGESIAAIIVIGLAVDYVIHLGHMYLEASHEDNLQTREERWEYAWRKMGSTVIAGAVTTFGAGIVMQFCTIIFFRQMSTLIVMTILYSIIYSMGLFMGVLLLIGPQGNQGDLSRLCPCLATLTEHRDRAGQKRPAGQTRIVRMDTE